MENFYEKMNGNGVAENGNLSPRSYAYQPSGIKGSLSWLDLRVFYIRVTKCEIDDSIPEFLTLNHLPLDQNTLLEVNGVRTGIYSDGASILLKRDRIDRKSEEVTFVSTVSIRMTGSVKFQVFYNDVLVLSGALELCPCNGFLGESRDQDQQWTISCESDFVAGAGFLNGKHISLDSGSPAVEVYVAGCFSGSPMILTNTLQLGHRKKQIRKGMLESIPEYEPSQSQKDDSSGLAMQVAEQQQYRTENEDYSHYYPGMEYFESEDGELSWFNAGVRVGVGIGLSVCLGIGIGVGLLVKTYQGTTRNFRRQLF